MHGVDLDDKYMLFNEEGSLIEEIAIPSLRQARPEVIVIGDQYFRIMNDKDIADISTGVKGYYKRTTGVRLSITVHG